MNNAEPIIISDSDDDNAVSSSAEIQNQKSKAKTKQQVTLQRIIQMKQKANALKIKQEKLDADEVQANLQNQTISANVVAIRAIKQEPIAVSSSTSAIRNYSECSNLSSSGTMENNNSKFNDADGSNSSDQSDKTDDFAADPENVAMVDKLEHNLKSIEAIKSAFKRGLLTEEQYNTTVKVFGILNNSSMSSERTNMELNTSNGSQAKENVSNASVGSVSNRPNCSTPIFSSNPRQTLSREPSRSRETSMSSIRNDAGIENSLNESIGANLGDSSRQGSSKKEQAKAKINTASPRKNNGANVANEERPNIKKRKRFSYDDDSIVSPTGKRLMAVKASARLVPERYSPKVKNAANDINNSKNSASYENAVPSTSAGLPETSSKQSSWISHRLQHRRRSCANRVAKYVDEDISSDYDTDTDLEPKKSSVSETNENAEKSKETEPISEIANKSFNKPGPKSKKIEAINKATAPQPVDANAATTDGIASDLLTPIKQLKSSREHLPSPKTDTNAPKKSNRIKNIDANVYASHQRYKSECVLCGEEALQCAAHYKKKHPDAEIFISRVSPQMMENLIAERVSLPAKGKYTCPFCEKLINNDDKNRLEHLAAHMGHALYECSKCKRQFNYTGTKHNKDCNSTNYKPIMHVTKEDEALCGYACKKCNYIQLVERNVIKHLENEHEMMDDDEIEECVLLIKLALAKETRAPAVISKTKRQSRALTDDDYKVLQPPKKIRKIDIAVPIRDIQNNDIQMYPTNPLHKSECALCGRDSHLLVNHYVKYHPNKEVYISRISTSSLDVIQSNAVRSSFGGGPGLTTAECIFCLKTFTKSQSNWIVHMISHSGEYMFHCETCDYKFAGISQHNDARCGGNDTIQLFDVECEEDGLYGYICKQCNYVQIREESVRKHLINEHDEMNESKLLEHFYEKIKLVDLNYEIPDDVVVNRIPGPPAVRQRTVRDIKNIDKNMYAKNVEYQGCCVVCDAPTRFPIVHYVQHHAEVYISRISQNVYDQYTTENPKSKFSRECHIEALCVFCEDDRTLTPASWISHLTTHTGEYQYNCKRCKRNIASQNGHLKSKCGGRTHDTKIDINCVQNTSGIYGFVCKLCNYVQLSLNRVILHLKEQHNVDELDVSDHYETIMLVSVQVDLQSAPRNNNEHVYYSNPENRDKCLLCNRPTKNIVNHYVHCHAGYEVYTSRISRPILDECNNDGVQKSIALADAKYKTFCLFCELDRTFNRRHWINHVTTHTGEYQYQCGQCKYTFAAGNGHASNSLCKGANMRNILNFELKDDCLYGYICELCNYIQLSAEKLIAHLLKQHDIVKSGDEEPPPPYRQIKLLDLTAENKANLKLARNDNKELYATNPKFKNKCALCRAKPSREVVHYVQHHADSEVYVSRLSPEMLERCIANTPQVTETSNHGVYTIFCIFCEEERKFQKQPWIDHFTIHTGEYMHKCEGCGLRYSRKNAHKTSTACKANSSKQKQIHKFHLIDNKMLAYYCTLCNFIQLSADHVRQHIERQHDITDPMALDEKCAQISLIQFDKSYATLKSPFKNINKEMVYTNAKYNSECVLCSAKQKPSRLANHYVQHHKNAELYISRLTDDAIKLCLNDLPQTRNIQNGKHEIYCVFCEKNIGGDKLKMAIEHLARHTGEWLYHCAKCDQKISSHYSHLHLSKCKPAHSDITEIYKIPFEEDGVFGYACKLCNYVQFAEIRTMEHLRTQHDLDGMEIELQYHKIKLLNMDLRNVKLNESRSIKMPRAIKGSSSAKISSAGLSPDKFVKLVKNNRKDMYYANDEFKSNCMLCNTRNNYLVSHCVNKHPTAEVYLSRLSEEMVEMCKTGVLLPKGSETKGLEAWCIFCEQYRIVYRSRWVEHITSHTGEFQYDCANCNRKVTSKRDHIKSKCTNALNIKRTVYFELNDDKFLHGFICKLCNFVQLTEESMNKHCVDQHEIAESEAANNYFNTKILDLTLRRGGSKAANASKIAIDNKSMNAEEEKYPPNDQKDFYFSNPVYEDKCVLCGKKASNIPVHYKIAHPNAEFYMSRISHRMIETITNGLPNLYRDEDESADVAYCVFCEEYIPTGKHSDWMVHLVRHTNEHLYECKKCSETFTWKVHHLSKKKCPAYNIKQIVDISIENNGISGFVCTLCNFVQFDKNRMINHVTKQHKIDNESDIDTNYMQVKLMNLERGPAPAEQTMDNKEQIDPSEMCSSVLNTSIGKEQANVMEEPCKTADAEVILKRARVVIERCESPKTKLNENKSTNEPVNKPVNEPANGPVNGPLKASANGSINESFTDSETDEANCLHENDTQPLIEVKEEMPLFSQNDNESLDICFVDLDDIEDHVNQRYKNEDELILPTFNDDIDMSADDLNIVDMSSDESFNNITVSDDIKFEIDIKPTITEYQCQSEASTSRIVQDTPPQSIKLKPWTNSAAKKAQADIMLNDVSLFALFKCMGNDCVFSCQSQKKMIQHLQFHEQFRYTAMSEIEAIAKHEDKVADYLECAYCSAYVNKPVELVDHIVNLHSNVFQCQHCFYRSVDAFALVNHIKNHHPNMEKVILLCNGYQSNLAVNYLSDLYELSLEHVTPITCHHDKREFYNTDHFIWHLKHQHQFDSFKCNICSRTLPLSQTKMHLNCHNIADFQCLYCNFAALNLNKISNHMANVHSDKLMFILARHYRSDISLSKIVHDKQHALVMINFGGKLNAKIEKADHADFSNIRFRELELKEEELDAIDPLMLPKLNNIALNKSNRTLDSKKPFSARGAFILETFTFHSSEDPYYTVDDFNILNTTNDDEFMKLEMNGAKAIRNGNI